MFSCATSKMGFRREKVITKLTMQKIIMHSLNSSFLIPCDTDAAASIIQLS